MPMKRWTLKVGVGGLVRTVKVQVHVDQWDGPERVLFSYKLEGDPVQGGGSYTRGRAGHWRDRGHAAGARRRQWADGADVGSDGKAAAARSSPDPLPSS